MSAPLSRLLEQVIDGEPPLGDEVDAVFRRAAKLRRRRTQAVLAAGAATAAVIVVLGYVLTSNLLAPRPTTMTSLPAATGPAPSAPATLPSAAAKPAPTAADAVLEVVAPLLEGRELRVAPGGAERGNGWREYAVADEQGRSRGTIRVGAFDVREDWCFPVRADAEACARPDRSAGLEWVRYDDVEDPDRQVRQTIARRLDDGRTVAVMAAGQRDAGAERGKPALTGAQVEQVATDERVFDAFRGDEDCRKKCPSFRTPVED
ncbi:hypothetical protein [Actinoplanes sp. URMC 104]|uniref:hypothetical protein n=1 Tax=Actinoplanes sp. URMC 104 TaxID=3423409 RepID=UPI003F197D06